MCTRSLVLLGLLIFSLSVARSARADEIADLKLRQELVAAKLALEKSQAELLKVQSENALSQVSIGDNLIKAAENSRRLELLKLKQRPFAVAVISGSVHPADNFSLSCDAKAFLQFSCAEPKEDCTFRSEERRVGKECRL